MNDLSSFLASMRDLARVDRLAAFADLLADAGCNEETILAHGRREAGHARGCWGVDLVLGRT